MSKSTVQSLSTRVKARLKAGEDANIDEFFQRQLDALNRSIQTVEHNMSVAKMEYEHRVVSIKDQISDAKKAVENSYMNVSPEALVTNASQDAFAKSYWDGVYKAELTLSGSTQALEDLQQNHHNQLKELEDQKYKLQARIDKIIGKN